MKRKSGFDHFGQQNFVKIFKNQSPKSDNCENNCLLKEKVGLWPKNFKNIWLFYYKIRVQCERFQARIGLKIELLTKMDGKITCLKTCFGSESICKVKYNI